MLRPATKVKICGITRLEDARAALAAGAWALGFIFHRPSPRYVSPSDVAAILRRLPSGTRGVGVFVDWPLDELNDAAVEAGLAAVQLHGSETPEYAGAVRAGEVWKAFRVGKVFDPEDVERYANVDRILLDSHDPERHGGTGTTCDWTLARQVQQRRPIVLAGGIDAENVARALKSVRPAALDVSSGVELRPGIKDAGKLRRLFEEVRRYEEE